MFISDCCYWPLIQEETNKVLSCYHDLFSSLFSMIPFRVNLTDRKSKESDLGYLQLSVCVSPINGDSKCILQVTDSLLDQRHQVTVYTN